jgi:hypothetical protein
MSNVRIQTDGLRKVEVSAAKLWGAAHQRFERTAQQSGGNDGQPNLHLGAPGPTHPSPDPYR